MKPLLHYFFTTFFLNVRVTIKMNCLSEFQLNAGNEVVSAFCKGDKPWHLLFAQPQSGKTDTFFFVAAEMLRLNKVSNVVIISGTDDKHLKSQSKHSFCNPKGHIDFCEKYDFYLESHLGLDRANRFQIKSILKSNLHFIWGNDLSKPHPFTANTLFVWDESHYAQTIDMRPYKFFKKLDIKCDGSIVGNSNFVLSVSATPFSELSHILKTDTEPLKGKTFLRVDSNYHGIHSVIEKNLLHSFNSKNLFLELPPILEKFNDPTYGIIRANDDSKTAIIYSVAKQLGWNVLRCNSDPKRRDISNLDIMLNSPRSKTLIIIKGMCRMGQVLNKKYLSFVMETSFDSNSETLIQGLLGRTLGWHNFPILVYINDVIFKRNDTSRYLDLINGNSVLPNKAKNLNKKGSNKFDAFCGNSFLPSKRVSKKNKEKLLSDWLNDFVHFV